MEREGEGRGGGRRGRSWRERGRGRKGSGGGRQKEREGEEGERNRGGMEGGGWWKSIGTSQNQVLFRFCAHYMINMPCCISTIIINLWFNVSYLGMKNTGYRPAGYTRKNSLLRHQTSTTSTSSTTGNSAQDELMRALAKRTSQSEVYSANRPWLK